MTNQEKLNLIAEKISTCQKCPELVKDRLKTVPGQGNPEARIVLAGEAPGRTEAETGVAFCGKSGELLTNILTACNIKRENVFILNICKCRPPNNRAPLPEESTNCRSFLNLQLKVINPKFIVCLGATAAQNLLNTQTPISQLRGQWHEYNGTKVLCTWHPSFGLRQKNAKHEIYKDLIKLIEELSKN